MWLKKIDLNAVLNNAESVCNALGFKLGQSWKMYVSELAKMPWTSIFLASLEVDCFDDDIKCRVLRAIHDGSNGLKSKRDFRDQQAELERPEQVVRKDEPPMEIYSVINEILNKPRL